MAYDWYTLSSTAAAIIAAVPVQTLRCNTDEGIYRKKLTIAFFYLKDALLGGVIAVLNITTKSKLTS